jgi:2,3-dihydroxybiphenyl 1,2-dioxygenase
VFHGAVLDHSPVITPFGAKFVTGDQGLGHVVVPATDPSAMFDFYTDILGFRSRGAFRVPLKPRGPKEFGPVRVRFLGINERHHSMAIVPAAHQRDPGVVHVMVEVDTLDAVGRALDRINADGFQLSSTLGRHTNDKMVSFYVRAPGDWDIEFGTDGMRVDETYYTAEEITADSYWGHQWVGDMPAAMRL